MIFKKQKELSDKFRNVNYEEEVTKFLWVPIMIDGDVRWLRKIKMRKIPWAKSSIFGTRFFWLYIEFLE